MNHDDSDGIERNNKGYTDGMLGLGATNGDPQYLAGYGAGRYMYEEEQKRKKEQEELYSRLKNANNWNEENTSFRFDSRESVQQHKDYLVLPVALIAILAILIIIILIIAMIAPAILCIGPF